jgi:iron complex outermembrane receptor protein
MSFAGSRVRPPVDWSCRQRAVERSALVWRFALSLLTAALLTPISSLASDEAILSDAPEKASDLSEDSNEADLFELPIEELVAMQVTSVAGVERDWFDTPSAITVLTGEQLMRSGFTTLADALRMVPGMHVGRVDSRQWAVTARGFSGLFSNNLQVVIDGRIVYNELFGGVYWDVQDLLFENIDRIEVIRGPGATLWGANAVNGVVNIITKSTADTVGNYVGGGAGNEERGFAEARHGGRFGESGSYRIWGRYAERDSSQREEDGRQRPDDWNLGSGGFQLENESEGGIKFMLQGQGHSTHKLGSALPGDGVGNAKSDGGHALARISQSKDRSNSWTVQAYYDLEDRRGVNGFDDRRDTYDLSFRHQLGLWESTWAANELLWGAGYRHRRQQTRPSSSLVLDPQDRNTNLVTGFIQDTVTLIDDQVFLMLGSKFENNEFSGFEVQPGGRLWWTPDDRFTIWGAISRPVRTPTLIEEDLIATLPAGKLLGDRSLNAETLVAYELGGRARLAEGLIVDVAAFFNQHDDLIRTSPAGGGSATFDNVGSARSYGVELSTIWQPVQQLRFEGSYSFFELDSGSALTKPSKKASPRHQFQIRSELDLTDRIGVDVSVYYVSRVWVGRQLAIRRSIDSYVRLDVGLHWKPYDWVEFAVFGQNLIGPHAEYFQPDRVDTQAEIERSIYGRLKFYF